MAVLTLRNWLQSGQWKTVYMPPGLCDTYDPTRHMIHTTHFDTNLKTERIQGNVFVKKEVYVTLVYFCQKTIPLF